MSSFGFTGSSRVILTPSCATPASFGDGSAITKGGGDGSEIATGGDGSGIVTGGDGSGMATGGDGSAITTGGEGSAKTTDGVGSSIAISTSF